MDFKAEYTQSGPLILMGISGGDAPNVVPASAEANLCCPPELAKELIHKLTAESGNAVTCTPTEQGIRIAAAGVSAHGAFPGSLASMPFGLLLTALDRLPLSEPLASQIHFLAEKNRSGIRRNPAWHRTFR